MLLGFAAAGTSARTARHPDYGPLVSSSSACSATHTDGGVSFPPRPVVLAEVAVAGLHLNGGVGTRGEGLQDVVADLHSRGTPAEWHPR